MTAGKKDVAQRPGVDGPSGNRGRGRFYVVVGPDGVGKTTAADALLDRWAGTGFYFHYCPSLSKPLESRPTTHFPPPPKASRTGSRLGGWLRLGRNLVKFWAAYALKILPNVRRGCLVVGDRWAYGYVGQPHGLRFYGPEWLATAALRLFPAPDAVLALSAPPRVVRERKQELDEAEIAAEMIRWSGLRGVHVIDIDATQAPDAIAESVLG